MKLLQKRPMKAILPDTPEVQLERDFLIDLKHLLEEHNAVLEANCDNNKDVLELVVTMHHLYKTHSITLISCSIDGNDPNSLDSDDIEAILIECYRG